MPELASIGPATTQDATEEARLLQLTARILDPAFRLPTLPAVASELMRLANQPDITFREVDGLIRSDPLVAARVLAVANSPLYRPTQPLVSLRAAMMRLGWTVLRDVLWQVLAESHVFRGGSRRQQQGIRLHSVATAHITRLLCRHVGLDGEFAFVSGLLHDLGRPVALQAMYDLPDLRPLATDEGLLDGLHGLVARRVASAWALPEPIVRVASLHHHWRREDDPMLTAVAAAERIGYHHGLGEKTEAVDPDDPVFDRLGLIPQEVVRVVERTAMLRQQIV